MAVRDDYITRILREIARVVAGALQKAGLGEFAGAHAELRQAARGLGVELGLLRSLTEDGLAAVFGGTANAAERVVALSDLLAAEAQLFAAEGRHAEAASSRARAQSLLRWVRAREPSRNSADIDARVATLADAERRSAHD